MKKYLILSVVVLVMISLSRCQFNIFTELDKIEIPNAADLSSKASSDPDGFLDDVNEYIDSESISEDDAAGVIGALKLVYGDATKPSDMTDDEWADVQEEAAVLAGEIAISSDPETKELVDNIVASLTELTDTTTGDEVLTGIFPENLTRDQFTAILNNLEIAAAAYEDFAASIDSDNNGIADVDAAVWLDSTEAGNLAMYAAIAMISTGIRDAADDDQALYSFIYNDDVTTIAGYNDSTENPLDTNALSAILDLAGIVY